MFGRFQVEIHGRQVEWIRRRDSLVFKYIALKRNGRATRAELAETFWPGADRHLVAQSVRTVCCNIRKAIARIVGFDTVDRYFRAGSDISIDLENVVIDVTRFLAHVNDGEQQCQRNDLRAALAHYSMAEKLYCNDLLSGEPDEECFAARADALEERYIMVLEHLAKITHELGDLEAAVTHARRVLELCPENESARAVLTMAS
jgi:DNA-binding SARP family transcriptional activator